MSSFPFIAVLILSLVCGTTPSAARGVIVKDPRLEYEAGRTPNILKVKHFSDMAG